MPEKTVQKEPGKKPKPQQEVVVQISLSELHPFPDHPFQVREDASMQETAESVKEYGVLVPALARPREDGGYELIAGHRRKHACELAGLTTMPVIVRDIDRDAATIIMVDSNLQRENILPSERAKAYKMKMEAIKWQGARTDLTSPKISAKFRSNDEVGQDAGVSGDTIRNYIALTQLVPELQQMDIDATVKGATVGIEEVENMIASIISVPVDDGVEFRVKRISEIMDEAEYPGIRVSMETEFDGVITPLKIDISTGDAITPREVRYSFKLMLEDRSIEIWAYNLETVLAEKLETVVSRATTNTRMRDFYDLHILSQLHGQSIVPADLRAALIATARKRGTEKYLADAPAAFDEVEAIQNTEKLWWAYQKNFSYATDLSWHTVMESIHSLYRLAQG